VLLFIAKEGKNERKMKKNEKTFGGFVKKQ
jgi:hypothetical protein